MLGQFLSCQWFQRAAGDWFIHPPKQSREQKESAWKNRQRQKGIYLDRRDLVVIWVIYLRAWVSASARICVVTWLVCQRVLGCRD